MSTFPKIGATVSNNLEVVEIRKRSKTNQEDNKTGAVETAENWESSSFMGKAGSISCR